MARDKKIKKRKKPEQNNSSYVNQLNDNLSKKNYWVTIIGTIITIIALIVTLYSIGIISLPNVNVKIYSWSVKPIYNEDNTTIIQLNTIFPSHITNTGNVPVHIVVYTVYLSENGNPVDLQEEAISEICYLKPQETFTYNLTKSFNVNLPVNSANVQDLTSYLIEVKYYTQNLYDIKSQWINPSEIR
jgi:hypothetical protein